MKHYDAELHTRGESLYVDDVPEPSGMLHAVIYSSPIAHGRFDALELDRALAADGVVDIITADDIPGENQVGPVVEDEPLLSEGELNFQGHPIAIVVAETHEDATHARGLIDAEFTEKEAVVTAREAHDRGDILGTPRTFAMGDVDDAFDDCDVVVEGRADCAGQEHLYLETQRARAVPTEGDRLRVYSSTQSPYAVQESAARVIGVAEHKVEVDVIRLGGAFGGKEDQATHWACMSALASELLDAPVQLVLHRVDDMKMTGKRHPYSADYKMGLDDDGNIVAYEVRHYQNAGAKTDLSLAVLERTLFHSTNAYYIPNVRAYAASCQTNIPPNTAFRGFGGPQGMFAIESALTDAAEELGISREEIQRNNLLDEGQSFPYGQRAERCRAQKTWDRADEAFDLDEMRADARAFNDEHDAKKKGVAAMPVCFGISFTGTFLNQASALLHVYTDGSVSLSTGGVEMGQGVNSKLINIAARALGISTDRIKVETTNTTRIANMSPSAASATTDLNGGATILAAEELLGRFREMIAREMGIQDDENIAFDDEQVLYRGKETDWDWERVVEQAYLSRISLSAQAFYATPNIWFDKDNEEGRPFAYHVYGAAFFEVTVDTLRGTYDIEAARLAHDLGRTVNKLVDIGQIEGGLAQGIGWMTLEELAYGDDGELLSSALSTYKTPDGYFMPDELDVEWIEDENPEGPYGSKAVGEPPLMYGIGAYFAIRDAMRAFDADADFPFDAPLTPEKVLLQLHQSRLDDMLDAPVSDEESPESEVALAGE